MVVTSCVSTMRLFAVAHASNFSSSRPAISAMSHGLDRSQASGARVRGRCRYQNTRPQATSLVLPAGEQSITKALRRPLRMSGYFVRHPIGTLLAMTSEPRSPLLRNPVRHDLGSAACRSSVLAVFERAGNLPEFIILRLKTLPFGNLAQFCFLHIQPVTSGTFPRPHFRCSFDDYIWDCRMGYSD
jgi:hypothetical protein